MKACIVKNNFIIWLAASLLNCMIDAIILAQAVLQVFCWQDYFTIQNDS